MTVEQQVRAIRSAAAVSVMSHVVCLRIAGEDAFDALDALCTADLFVRDGQMLHTLLLRDDATILADLYLCGDDEDFILLAEGPSATELKEHIENHMRPKLDPDVLDLSEDHVLLSLGGPYAWEVMAGVAGAEVIGLPYMTFYHDEDWTCFRAGKTGEFGYDLLVPRQHLAALRARIGAAAEKLELPLEEVGVEALDQCALENWFFNIRREGRHALTPLELQRQWRVSYRKEYVGSAALCERRARGQSSRVTCVVSDSSLTEGAEVHHEGRAMGKLINAGYSHVRGDWVGLALLDLPFAHSGVRGYSALDTEGTHHPLRTVSPPVLNNRSLFIDLQRQSWRTRTTDTFPPVVPERCPP